MSARRGLAAALALALCGPLAAQDRPAAGIPAHPDQLTYPPLTYTPPRPADFRAVLANGMVVYVAEDRTLPLVSLSVTFRGGSYLEPAGKEGLAALTGAQMRRGGTRSLDAAAFDERMDFLAAQAGAAVGPTAGSASLNCLADNLEESLRLFVEMLRAPRFQPDRLDLAKVQMLQQLAARNDEAEGIEGREWGRLLQGPSFFTNRLPTRASVESISREDLVAFHRRVFHPARAIVAVSGAFARAEILRKLEAAFAGDWGPAPTVPPVPADLAPAEPGVYVVDKDIPQARVSIGLPTVRRDSPDIYALEVMNEILGGAGFASRITRRVRSDEGLAYQAASSLSFGVWYPGSFRAVLQSKTASATRAAAMVLQEIRSLREAPVSAEELQLVKQSLVESFPSTFASRAQTVGLFASDEYTGRPPDFWARYRERIQAVSAADVQRVARQYLLPEKLRVLVVGDRAGLDRGEGEHPVPLTALGPAVVAVPLRDPLTLEPLPAAP